MFKILANAGDDGALYLGPYGGRQDTRKAIAAVSKALKLPTCGKNIKRILGKERPCLNHHMGNCRAYCQSPELAEDHRKTMQAAIEIFQGKSKGLIKKLTVEMNEASDNLSFENAALIRDRIRAIQQLEQRQIVSVEAIAERAAIREEKVLKTHQWLQNALKLETMPERIEAFDVSNTGASDIVASMTVFVKGKPKKSDYRRFKIKSKKGQDDYGSMVEVVSRRIARNLEGDEKFLILPDIMLIDGGANHAAIVHKTLCEAGVSLPVFGMVKDGKHRTRALVSPHGEEIGLAANPAVFALIGTIQEETHRFAVEYHRNQRSKNSYKSKLDLIDGVGEKRRYKLLKKFGSVKAIAAATVDELGKVVPKDVAARVHAYFNGQDIVQAEASELEENGEKTD
jgi:excinuclease UvrABC nuclease subunit